MDKEDKQSAGMTALKADVMDAVYRAGAVAAGCARGADTSALYREKYARWLSRGHNAAMEYMAGHMNIRRHPALLLNPQTEDNNTPAAIYVEAPEATVIVCAFSYFTKEKPQGDAILAMYARGADYHDVLRRRLAAAAELLTSQGFKARICVDSAPLAEKYWAVLAGVGFIGRNSLLITPQAGSYVFLAEIITDAPLEADNPSTDTCIRCGRCMDACPGGAIMPDCTVDASRCISYLTIEKRGEWTDEERAIVQKGAPGYIYGCDICQSVCPHNRDLSALTTPGEFHMSEKVSVLTRIKVQELTQKEFSEIFGKSAVKRARLAGLKRNVRE